jgi:L-seryl-tRNA(Ser) seleniumtransferase
MVKIIVKKDANVRYSPQGGAQPKLCRQHARIPLEEATLTGAYRDLPSVDRILGDSRVGALTAEYSAPTVTELVRHHLADLRRAIADGRPCPPFDDIVSSLLERVASSLAPSLRPVINATGVIIHTNLGRAPLPDEALEAMAAVGRGYSNLEFDLEEGERGSRFVHLEGLLCRLTGAEAAIAVNNNASALLLALSALAQGREVIISRGQLVEIGGGFRIPDVMRQSGARLVEVGTTNRTYLRDYEEAIGEETAGLMRVHASNFRLTGFTHSVPLANLAALAHRRSLLLFDDLGSGCLLDTRPFGLAAEPTPQESLAADADLVLFSADKLLGGPQAGIILGKQNLVSTLRRHPLARAVRLDKTSIAGLTATLLHYLRGEALTKVPVWRMIAAPLADLERRAHRWARACRQASLPARVVEGRSMVGGGSLPEESLPTRLLALGGDGSLDAEALARRLRKGEPAVVGRIERDTLLLDPRTVDPREDRTLLEALLAALAAANPAG